MAGPNSLSAKEISEAAKKSAEKALAQHRIPPGGPIGFVRPPWWWVGIIIRDPGLKTLAEAESLAKEIHAGVAAASPSAKAAIPGCVIQGGHLTIGFAPPEPVNLLEG